MQRGFWKKLKKPFFALAPMADVTDAAFRRIIAKYSRPYGPAVFWTEFVSADGLVRAPKEGRGKLLRDLEFSEEERPIVAQFFTGSPENMEKAAALAREMGFDGVDINMGCPDRSIERQGGGAALIKNPSLAKEIIAAAKIGAKDIPVSVKTRLGYSRNDIDVWLPILLSTGIAAITLHARTRKEMSLVPAHWEEVKRATEIRNALSSPTLIIGNGDAVSLEDARVRAEETLCDGIMIGRGIFGNPWLFSNSAEHWNSERKLRVAIEHTKLFEEYLRGVKSFSIMKKHFKAYVNGFEGARELREELMKAHNAQEVEYIIRAFLSQGRRGVLEESLALA